MSGHDLLDEAHRLISDACNGAIVPQPAWLDGAKQWLVEYTEWMEEVHSDVEPTTFASEDQIEEWVQEDAKLTDRQQEQAEGWPE